MSERTRVARGCLLALVAPLLVISCGVDDSPTTGAQGDGGNEGSGGEPAGVAGAGDRESTVIGPKGGVVVSDDGLLELTIPAGALEESTAISITGLAAGESAALTDTTWKGAYRFEPDGLEFAEPATFAYTVEDFVTGDESTATLPMLLVTSESAGDVEAIDRQALHVNLDTNHATLTGPLSHFSQLVFSSLGPGLDTVFFYVTVEPRPPQEAEVGTDYGVGLFVHTKSVLAREAVLTYDDESSNLDYSEGAAPYEIAAFGGSGDEPGRDIVPVGTYACAAVGDATFRVRLTTGLLELPPFQGMTGVGGSSKPGAIAFEVFPPPSVYDITITSQLTCNEAGVGPDPVEGAPYSGVVDYNAHFHEQQFVPNSFLGAELHGSFYGGGAAQAEFDAWVATRQRMLGIVDNRLASGDCRALTGTEIVLGQAPPPAGTATQVAAGAANRLAFSFPDTEQFEPVFLDWIAPLRAYTFTDHAAAPEPSPSGIEVFVPAGAAAPTVTLPGWDATTWGGFASFRGEDGLEVTWDADLLQADYVHAIVYGYSEAGSKFAECFTELADQQLLVPQQVINDTYVPPLNEEVGTLEVHMLSGRRTGVIYDGRTLEGLIRRDTRLLY